MESIRIVKLNYSHFAACVEFSVWGANKNILTRWKDGDYVIFKTESEVLGVAVVNGDPFTSEDVLWESDLYPYRIPVKFIHIVGKKDLEKVTSDVRSELIRAFGFSYGFYILRQHPLPTETANNILRIILSSSNDLSSS